MTQTVTPVHEPNCADRKQKAENSSTKLQLLACVLATLATTGRLFGKEILVDVGKDTALGDCDVPKKLVQLLVVADGELEMTGDDTSLLVVAGSVASELENFGSEVLEDGSEIDGGTSTDTLSIVALAQETVDTTDRECETRLGRTGLRVLGTAGLAAGLSAASHFDGFLGWLGVGSG